MLLHVSGSTYVNLRILCVHFTLGQVGKTCWSRKCSFLLSDTLALLIPCTMFNLYLYVQKMVNGGRVQNWICVSFSRNLHEDAVYNFCDHLAGICRNIGMVFSQVICLIIWLSKLLACSICFGLLGYEP